MRLQRIIISCILFSAFLLMIPCANYTLLHFGTICAPNSPCVIPVWFYPVIYAPSGVLFAGLALVLRDLLQRNSGFYFSILAVIIGTLISYFYVDPTIAIAGSVAYSTSELFDTIIYTLLQRYNLLIAILISSTTGVIIDSVLFLQIKFHSLNYLPGQLIGKLWMVILSILILKYIFKRRFR